MKRVWIYQADRILTPDEISRIEQKLTDFTSSWTAHGSALAGTGFVKYGVFLQLIVDEEQAGVTGCSIDKSVHFIKALEQEFQINFFDRMNVAYRDTANQLHVVGRAAFESLLASGAVNANTIVFNNMVNDAERLATDWEVPFKESWHSKVF